MSDIVDDDLASFWAPPEPRELPALRAALAEHMLSPYELEMTAGILAAGKGALVPAGSPRQAAATLLADENRRLRAADLYFLTEEMSELARVAGAGLPTFRLEREDVPTPCGFVQFASPLGGYVFDEPHGGHRRRTHIVACSWGITSRRDGGEGVWVTFWCPTNRDDFVTRFVKEDGLRRADAERIVRTMRAELTWDNEAFLPFGGRGLAMVDRNRAVACGDSDESSAPWIQTLRAAWLLMGQPGITDVDRQRLSRQQQRRAVREGLSAGDIQVVRLRAHPGGDRTATDAGRAYTARWMVRGHWRQQPHGPQRGLRRPVWINPHVKGPAGLPLSTKEKVILVDRPAAEDQ